MFAEKLATLRRLIESYESCLIAYSGGVDSAFLAFVAHDVLGDRVIAVIADSPSLPRRELEEAVGLAGRFKIPLRVIRTREFDNPDYLANPPNRCFFCKRELFSRLVPLAKAEGFRVLAYGENASDVGDHRPGAAAAAEFEVRAPLKEAGLSKDEIRRLSAGLGLPTADKPQMPCLSSRIPHGELVTSDKLRMIEAAENLLRDAGFRDVRVRHHELSMGALARIEVGREEIARLTGSGRDARLTDAIRALGYSEVRVDPLGYRRGSLNTIDGGRLLHPSERSGT
ncbi:MAG TPA: ATP-dependent sacrificial sulfur transferase LarE [Methylomirabilota bacterium]|nr:ATP-dependent sacrificial sulfur transferase LarE [Methylomirabilota bacterium]